MTSTDEPAQKPYGLTSGPGEGFPGVGAAFPATDVGFPMRTGYAVGDVPRIAERTARAAELEGYDPDVPNAPLSRRFAALALDSLIYFVAVAAFVLGVAALDVQDPSGEVAQVLLVFLLTVGAPLGFYAYRAAGDAIFEGSPGKRALGLTLTGPHGLPVSASDGLRRNLWILPSVIPVAGWAASAVLMAVNAVSAGVDPLGRGRHDRFVGTRVQEGTSAGAGPGRRNRGRRRRPGGDR